MKITTIGIDLAKTVLQVHGVDKHGKAGLKKQLKRKDVSLRRLIITSPVAYATSPDCIRLTPARSIPRRGKRALRVDRTTRIVNYRRGESQFARVERGPCDAEVRRKPTDVDAVDAALPQVAAKPGRGFSIRLDEGGVAVDVHVVTLAQHQLGLRKVEIPAQACTLGALDAVVGPQYLLAVVERDLVEWFLARVRGRERTMSRRMPILGEHHIGKTLGHVVDDRYDFVASWNGEAATWQE